MNDLCSIELLRNAVARGLSGDEEAALHAHLEHCEACCAQMEQLAGGEAWQQEAAALLSADELDAAVPEPAVWSDVDFSVEHLDPSDDPNVLGQLGGYDVLAIVGRGGMGVVLKAFDRELKRLVAIKALAPHLAHSSVARKRFAREAQAAAAVVNPHVIAIHHVQPTGRLPFLIMPLLTGESLAQRLKARGPLELTEVLRIGMQAAAGLAAAHDQGLVHRDVKPANIFLEKGVERVVITDFGLARAADDVSMTRQGVVAGTPEYMSPEQARGEALDGRSDLFSLGCVLYEMATGVSPFRTDSTMATLRRIVDEQPAAMASLVPELPPWFCHIVERLLSKDPAQRFASASEVSQLLEQCLSHLQQPTSVPLPECCLSLRESSDSFAERKATLLRRSPLISILTAIGFASLLIFAGIVIVLEFGKGKLTITSEADDIPIRIMQGDDVVESLTVSHAGRTVRLAAGRYQVEIDGNIDGIAVAGDTVTLKRHGAETVRIVRSADAATVHKPDDIPHRVADKPKRGTTRIRVHANGKPVTDNAVILGTEGYPGQFLPRLSETPSHRGVISLERLAAGTHWLLVRDNNTVLRIQLPEERVDVLAIETSLPKHPSLIGKDLDVKVTVEARKHWVAEASRIGMEVEAGAILGMVVEDTVEFIAVEIHNRTDAAIVITEANLQLFTAINGRDGDARVMSPLWSRVAAGKTIPATTIQPDQTAKLRLNWNDWVKRGYWFSRDGEHITEPHFRFPVSEVGKTWVRVMLGNAPPVPVTHPDKIVARDAVPGMAEDLNPAEVTLATVDSARIVPLNDLKTKEGQRLVQLDRVVAEGSFDLAGRSPGDFSGGRAFVMVKFDQGTTSVLEGIVTFVNPRANADGKYHIQVTVENRQIDGKWLLVPGESVQLTIHGKATPFNEEAAKHPPIEPSTDRGVDVVDELLEGVWELALPPDIAAKRPEDQRLRLVIAGDWQGRFQGDQRVSASRLTVEPQHTPIRLSFVGVDGKPMRGIYEVKEDGLRLSIAPDTEALPTKFGTEHPEFKRVKGKLAEEQLAALKKYSVESTVPGTRSDSPEGSKSRPQPPDRETKKDVPRKWPFKDNGTLTQTQPHESRIPVRAKLLVVKRDWSNASDKKPQDGIRKALSELPNTPVSRAAKARIAEAGSLGPDDLVSNLGLPSVFGAEDFASLQSWLRDQGLLLGELPVEQKAEPRADERWTSRIDLSAADVAGLIGKWSMLVEMRPASARPDEQGIFRVVNHPYYLAIIDISRTQQVMESQPGGPRLRGAALRKTPKFHFYLPKKRVVAIDWDAQLNQDLGSKVILVVEDAEVPEPRSSVAEFRLPERIGSLYLDEERRWLSPPGDLADIVRGEATSVPAVATPGIRVTLRLNTEKHSREMLQKNIGFDQLSIMGSGVKGTIAGKTSDNLVVVLAHGCRLESFEETEHRGKKSWDATFYVPQGPTSDGSNRDLSQKGLDHMQEQGVQFWLDHHRDQVSGGQKSVSVDPTAPAAMPPPIEFRIAVSKADREADGVAWFPIMEPRIPAPAGQSGANLPIEEKPEYQWRGLLWGKTEHTLLADGTWRVVKCDVAQSAHSTDVAPSFEIQITLDAVGGPLLRRLTGTHLNQSLAIVVDGTIVAAPVLRTEFGADFVISGNFTKAAAEKLAAAISKPDQRKKLASDESPRTISIFVLRFADAKSALAALKDEAASRKIRGFEATVDPKQNSILIIADADTLKTLQEILNRLDSNDTSSSKSLSQPPRIRKTETLADAVAAFNAKAKLDPIGKDQPELTEDEVVAAIRGWVRENVPASDEVYDAFQKIAETRRLPERARLHHTTSTLGDRGYDSDVWWVDLSIFTGEKTGYTFRIRDQKIRSRPTNQQPSVTRKTEKIERIEPHWRKYGVTPAPVSELTAKVLESIGLHLRPITKDSFREKNVFANYSGGLDVTFVRSDTGTAGKAGIHEVDIVVKLQGRLIVNLADLDAAMQDAAEQIASKAADALQFDVLRSGETVRVNVPFPNPQLDQR